MSQTRIKLDNPAFEGTLRYTRRGVSYNSRPLQPKTIQDVAAVRQKPKRALGQDAWPGKPARPAPAAKQRHSAPARTKTLTRAAAVRPKVKRRKRGLFTVARRTVMVYGAAVLIFGFGLYVGIGGLLANREVSGQVQGLQKVAENNETSGGTGDAPPSTEKPSDSAVRNYVVAPANPRYIDIPSLNIHSRILSMGVDKNNELKAPYGIYDAGWYDASSKPGEAGAMLLDGHSGIGNTNGIFHDIHDLPVGTDIIITRGDGQKYTYTVVKAEITPAEKVNMGSLLVSKDTAKPGLNLITCTGDWIPGTFSLKERAIVYAVMK